MRSSRSTPPSRTLAPATSPTRCEAAASSTVPLRRHLAFGDLAQKEVAEDLDALRVPKLFRVHEIGVDARPLEFRQHAHQGARFEGHEFRQRGKAKSALHR